MFTPANRLCSDRPKSLPAKAKFLLFLLYALFPHLIVSRTGTPKGPALLRLPGTLPQRSTGKIVLLRAPEATGRGGHRRTYRRELPERRTFRRTVCRRSFPAQTLG